jgi:hypothetical protein
MFVLKPTKKDLYILGFFLLIIIALSVAITNPIFFLQRTSVDFQTADSQSLSAHVNFLSNMEPGRGYHNLDSLNEAARYIESVFSQYCPSTKRQTYQVEGKEFVNLLCSFNEGATERIIIGAHYDTYSSMPGADDNASGVAGILELARMLQANGVRTSKQIDLVAFTLEEPPFFSSDDMGSFWHAKQLKSEGVNVKVAIILEMIGYYSDNKDTQTLPLTVLAPLYPSKGNFVAVIGKFGQGDVLRSVKKHLKESTSIDVRSFSGPTFIKTIDFSDHRSYWLHDYPAVMITDTSFYRNNNYHTENDLPETLDYTRMADVINGVYWAAINI